MGLEAQLQHTLGDFENVVIIVVVGVEVSVIVVGINVVGVGGLVFVVVVVVVDCILTVCRLKCLLSCVQHIFDC